MGTLFGPQSYPLHLFPPIAQNAVFELRKNCGTPYEVIGSCILGAMAAACQWRIRVHVFGEDHHVSLYILAASETGSAKSPAYRKVFAPFVAYEKACELDYLKALVDYKTDFDYWDSVNKGILKQIKDAAKRKDCDEQLLSLKNKLKSHAEKNPPKPRDLSFMKKNILANGLIKALEGDDRSVLLATDEADKDLDGGIMSEYAILNAAWESETLIYERLNRKIISHQPNVTICFLPQPFSCRTYFQENGKRARALGLMPRFLTTIVPPNPEDSPTPIKDQIWNDVALLHDRINDLIDERRHRNGVDMRHPIVVEFDDEAKLMFHRMMVGKKEELSKAGGPLHEIKEFVHKAPMNIARVAAIFHYFSGETGKITAETLQNAAQLVDWYLSQAKIIFGKAPEVPQAYVDAEALEKYLHRAIFVEGNHACGTMPVNHTVVMKNYVLQCCTPVYATN